jgi:hypothetical protein
MALAMAAAPASAKHKWTVTGCTVYVLEDRGGELTYTKENGDTKVKRTTREKAEQEAGEAGIECSLIR